MRTLAAVEAFTQSRVSANLSVKSIAWYHARLARFAAVYPELPLDPIAIESFLASIPGAPETRHGYYRAIKAFYRFLKKRHILPPKADNPIELIEPPRIPKKVMSTLEPVELMRLLLAADSPREKAIIILFIDTGIRASELAGLRREDVREGFIVVRGKSGQREVPVSDETMIALRAMAAMSKSPFLFQGYKGQPLTRKSVYWTIQKIMSRAGITGPKRGPHRIRHSFGKGFLVNGGDVRSLQLILGHANIATTQKYAALNLKDLTSKHHQFTVLRSTHAAAQENFLDKVEAVKEANAIINKKEA